MSNKSILEEIIEDYAPLSKSLKRVGVTGSYSRGDFTNESDIDLVFDFDEPVMDDSTLAVGRAIKQIFLDQLRKNVDIIDYNTILLKKDTPGRYYFQEGYKKMYDDLIWVWEMKK